MKTVHWVKLLTGAALILVAALALWGSGVPERFLRLRYGAAPGVTLEGVEVGGRLRGEVYALVREMARERDRLPRNAYLDPGTGEIIPETAGRLVDRDGSVELVLTAPRGSRVILETVQIDPEITVRLFERIYREAGAYRTFYGYGGGRNVNIETAAAAINNYLLLPGEVFSFNRGVGPRTVERGYELAPIIVGNAVVPGLGGGICQVSSTLYNAVLAAKLEVVERYPHSLPVGYVPPGRDATVSDYLDFQFRNSSDRLVLIKTACWGGWIDIRIFTD